LGLSPTSKLDRELVTFADVHSLLDEEPYI